MPFAESFAERVLRHTDELATGRAFVPGMGANCWREVESRMKAFVDKPAAARNRRRKRTN
jgi:hypothetical protein